MRGVGNRQPFLSHISGKTTGSRGRNYCKETGDAVRVYGQFSIPEYDYFFISFLRGLFFLRLPIISPKMCNKSFFLSMKMGICGTYISAEFRNEDIEFIRECLRNVQKVISHPPRRTKHFSKLDEGQKKVSI